MAKDTKMKTIEERAKRNAVKAIEYACGRRVGEPEYITNLFIQMATEQKVIDDKRKDVLLHYLEELEAHYRDLGQYDDGKPIRRVIEYVKSFEE